MLIEIIDVDRISVFKAERYPPVPGYRHGPVASEIATQGVQPEARQVHVFRRAAAIEDSENVAQFLNVLWRDAPAGDSDVVCHLSNDNTPSLNHRPKGRNMAKTD